ncbi:hypothetical protein DXG01_002491 [Tephrocybe rancida]|nr:hypothetical protein DXG01_002491 [Tephrocybe rancida]
MPVASSSSAGSPLKTVQIQVIDDDEMFMRNRNRSTGAWATLEKLTKGELLDRGQLIQIADQFVLDVKAVLSDSDSDDGNATPKRKRAKRRQGTTSSWQNKKSLTRLLSEEIPSDDSDDGVEVIGTSTTPRASQAAKRKRPRSRSRSITPPPELPHQQVQHMRALVEQTLNTAPQPTSRDDDDDEEEDDAVFMNPEFAQLAKSARSRAHPQGPVSSPVPEGVDTVQISVKWKPHPQNPGGKEDVWVFKMNREDNFRELFEATAEEASIRTENLILTYEGKHMGGGRFGQVSVLDFAADRLLTLNPVGCDKATHDYLRANPVVAAPSFNVAVEEIPSDTDAPSPSQDQGNDDKEQDSDAEGGTFKLILRSSAAAKDITLTVRPTTKCGAIVKAYLKKAGLADQYPALFAEGGGAKKVGKGKKAQPEKDPRLCVDGEKLGNDVEISEADLEDGDMVEVMGL